MDYYKLKVLNNKKKIMIIIVLLLLVGILAYYWFNDSDEDVLVNNTLGAALEKEESITRDIIVDIKGYVEKPGVYSFSDKDNARINDLIIKAGGLKKDADTSMINLSKKLEDEMTIVIYSKNEITNYIKTQDELKKKLELCESKIKNNACIEEKVEEKVSNKKINLNSASLSELMELSGIGESKAKAIIEYRKKSKFKTIEDIMKVDGIGESLFNSIKESITV